MSRTRQILAIVAVTTALCADHVVAAQPAARGHLTEMAGRLVSRLSQSFRRVIPSNVRIAARQEWPSAAPTPEPIEVSPAAPVRMAFSPFQFRLPPPALLMMW